MADIFRYRADVVVVDEASQVPLAFGAQLGLLGFSTLLFGDPAQLNAIFPAAIADEPLACSILERYAAVYPLQRLTLTYRLNQSLADLVGSVFYPDADGHSTLTPTPAAASRRLNVNVNGIDPWAEAVLAPDLPAVWVQTGERGRRQTSALEAELIVRLVQRLTRERVSGRQVAVVTPFRQQVQLLNRKLARLRPSERPRLGTVETMQGQSVEVVLISLAASEPTYLGAVNGFYFLPNRWNVAISRARTKVVVVGSEVVLQAAQGTALGSVLAGLATMAAADGLMP
jgi:superfamily I DNA and/or RNA helicase